jgi:5S rRNA maturation endonuclease (ribonuclease M5)
MTQIYRSFNEVILMTDDDEPGIKFGKKIAKKCRENGIGVLRAQWDQYNLFPNGAKDVCDQDSNGKLLVSEQDINTCIEHREMLYL